MTDFNQLRKALFIKERRIRVSSLLYIFEGIKRIRTWENLSGFKKNRRNFSRRLALTNSSYVEFCLLIGDKNPKPNRRTKHEWLRFDYRNGCNKTAHSQLLEKSPTFRYYQDRGIISPFNSLISDSIHKIQEDLTIGLTELEPFLPGIFNSIEQITKRAFILDLNVRSLQGKLKGSNKKEEYQNFVTGFTNKEQQASFFHSYPVLYRAGCIKTSFWRNAVTEFLQRLDADRRALNDLFALPLTGVLTSVTQSGDTHNNGRAVFIVEFDNTTKLVYKPRSVKLELGFQKYINFFNSLRAGPELRTIKVLDKDDYGWVEFVHFEKQSTQAESDIYHFKLGFITALVYSLSGVDIFFENLVSSGTDPIIIDLETLFHTPVDLDTNATPSRNLENFINSSVAGIGILPRPSKGATSDGIFDVSVMGARQNAQAPYKVPNFKNFGQSDMRITEVAGWIPEVKSSWEGEFSVDSLKNRFYSGLTTGFECLINNKEDLVATGGIIDQCFKGAIRRLIVRDTKTYGTLQLDESHPDFLRDQVDREWHWDHLWAELNERPALSHFIESELSQTAVYDIPYFCGSIESKVVIGGDYKEIDLTNILSRTPLDNAKDKIIKLDTFEINKQKNLAATLLGIKNLTNVTAPSLSQNRNFLENATSVADFVISRLVRSQSGCWAYTTYNPISGSSRNDAVNIVPCDISLYDGMAGIALFLHKTWIVTKDVRFHNWAIELVDSILIETRSNTNIPASGFLGISSVLYVVNKMISEEQNSYSRYDKELPELMTRISKVVEGEERLDFLIGLAGVACAMLPYTKRTDDSLGIKTLATLMQKLLNGAGELLTADRPIAGMSNLRGLSHGISGISLALYRLGIYFSNDTALNVAGTLLCRESQLVERGGWTDTHLFDGAPLVGWCHGSAGVALTLANVPDILRNEPTLKKYRENAVCNTRLKGHFPSMCLCHGSFGNVFCLRPNEDNSKHILAAKSEKTVLAEGFESLDIAQTLGLGLMTGITGVGYYFLAKFTEEVDSDFLTLA